MSLVERIRGRLPYVIPLSLARGVLECGVVCERRAVLRQLLERRSEAMVPLLSTIRRSDYVTLPRPGLVDPGDRLGEVEVRGQYRFDYLVENRVGERLPPLQRLV